MVSVDGAGFLLFFRHLSGGHLTLIFCCWGDLVAIREEPATISLYKHRSTRGDPDFKEVFGFVYHGASFILVSNSMWLWDP